MAKIYDSIMPLIKPGRIATAAATLGETDQKVSSAVDIILPTLLARLLKKGDTPEIREIAAEAGRLRVSSDYNQIWDGNGIFDGRNIGERMENQLLGTENPKFFSAVAAKTGLRKDNVDRLTNWVAGTIAGAIGEKVAGGKSYASILSDLAMEKEQLRRDIPSNIISELGLGTVLGVTNTANRTTTGTNKVVSEKSGRWNWLMWLALIVLILLLFLWWRSCDRKRNADEMVTNRTEVTTPVPAPEPVREVDTRMPKEKKITLADGQVVNTYEGSSEDQIKAYLDSDKFKNATADQRGTVWFEFSDIEFEHNSATDLMGNGERQVRNLASMLKNYPDVKVKIGAFADKTGTRATNFAISEKRAENIKAALQEAGVAANRITTVGFGERYAEVAENATDAQRAEDRDIAVNFTK